MPESDIPATVKRSLNRDTGAEFRRRVETQATALTDALTSGEFDNDVFSIGLELEGYAVDEDGNLAPVPETVFETPSLNPELGYHNLELNTGPDVFDADGIAAQATQIREHVEAGRSILADAGLELVLDSLWTIPPPSGTMAYLSDTETRDRVTIAENMRASPRYSAIDNDLLEQAGGQIELVLPGVRVSFPSILVESLITSIQPHLQIPDVGTFPSYYNLALRTLGPVLALATNSPFLPADLYERETDGSISKAAETGYGGSTLTEEQATVSDPYKLVERTYHELRIPVFEQSINTGASNRKVRLPRDIDDPTEPVHRLIDDQTCAPFLKEWVKDADAVEEYTDRIWEINHKRSTYWRWLRPVFGGETLPGVSERSLRLEYRPLPTQPSVTDVVGLQVLVVGLIRGLHKADHPITSLEWSAARENFYRAVEDGLSAEFTWIDASGAWTESAASIFNEVFEYARLGLREQGLEDRDIDSYLTPIETRWVERVTPSRWKKRRVTDRLDRGETLRSAIEGMQREYIEKSRSDDPFVDW